MDVSPLHVYVIVGNSHAQVRLNFGWKPQYLSAFEYRMSQRGGRVSEQLFFLEISEVVRLTRVFGKFQIITAGYN